MYARVVEAPAQRGFQGPDPAGRAQRPAVVIGAPLDDDEVVDGEDDGGRPDDHQAVVQHGQVGVWWGRGWGRSERA